MRHSLAPVCALLAALLTATLAAAPAESDTYHETPQAGSARELDAKLQRYQSMRFTFSQQISSELEGHFEETSGVAYLQRPNKVRWETTKPYSQLIVSDGDVVWLYDPDLLQAVRKKSSLNPVEAPALLLLSDTETLERHFEVFKLGIREKVQWFLLSPKSDAFPVKLIEIGFLGNRLHSFLIEDHHLQRSLFTLTNMRANPKLSTDHFQFTPPPGTDIADQASLPPPSSDCAQAGGC